MIISNCPLSTVTKNNGDVHLTMTKETENGDCRVKSSYEKQLSTNMSTETLYVQSVNRHNTLLRKQVSVMPNHSLVSNTFRPNLAFTHNPAFPSNHNPLPQRPFKPNLTFMVNYHNSFGPFMSMYCII